MAPAIYKPLPTQDSGPTDPPEQRIYRRRYCYLPICLLGAAFFVWGLISIWPYKTHSPATIPSVSPSSQISDMSIDSGKYSVG